MTTRDRERHEETPRDAGRQAEENTSSGPGQRRRLAGLVLGFALLPGMAEVSTAAEEHWRLESPDGRVAVEIQLAETADQPAALFYALQVGGRPVLQPSRLGWDLRDRPLGALAVTGVRNGAANRTWKPVWGERSVIRDHYRELTLELREQSAPRRRLEVQFRAYNEGAAFRTRFLPADHRPGAVVIRRERTEFRFAGDWRTWAVYSAQGRYQETRISGVRSGCERPLTVEVAPDLYVAVGEAALVDYARMKLGPLPGAAHALVSELGSEVVSALPMATPWRVFLVGRSPGELLEHNDLFLNLNEPCALADTSWIRPGKVIREVTLTTQGGLACVDFAASHGLQYIEYDAGWYGPENSERSDARTVTLDPKRSKGPLDLPRVLRYARDKGIGVILYVNRRALERQLDDILPLYRRWGVSGVKYGFVNVGSQYWTSWLHDAVRRAAAHRLMVDIHDEYRPTGYSRTYPNLMTQEGIAGDETSPDNELTLTILFTRMLAGPGDNTVCYYNRRVDQKASHAYQLAKAVCLFSPWQFLYWYDRPPGSPGHPGPDRAGEGHIGSEPELEFFAATPTTWDETRVLQGRIGRFAIVARRSGREWFIGAMNGNEPQRFEEPLDFLEPGLVYEARLYRDDPSLPTRTHVRIDRREVRRGDRLTFDLPARGGMAVHLRPTDR